MRLVLRFVAVLALLTGGAVANATTAAFATIPPRLPVLVPGATSVSEGTGVGNSVPISIALSHASTSVVSVQYRTIFVPGAPDHQASPTSDYAPVSGTLVFAPGTTSQVVSVETVGDSTVEPDEYFVLQFGNPTNATMGGFWGLGIGGIVNDDGTTVH